MWQQLFIYNPFQDLRQKPWAMEDVFGILVPFIFIAATEPVVIFVGYNFLIADQNLSEEEANLQ